MIIIDWTFDAREDIQSIKKYLKEEKASKKVIANVIGDIIDAPTHLKSHPKSGRKIPEIDQENFREIVHKKYRILYFLPDDNPGIIYILSVIHGRQDIGPILSQIWQRFLN